ncbi:MAG: OadG family protein [Clostridiaceae bacterium]|jgi:Na+-transporting methylmalonyl-CoA/oxaloacetate decarboxylase gamma subunit|nr:OadG family protein [Clostridiaceae bacterium]
MSDLSLGLQLMEYGLAGVFLVLILFYVLIIILMKLFPYHPEKEED